MYLQDGAWCCNLHTCLCTLFTTATIPTWFLWSFLNSNLYTCTCTCTHVQYSRMQKKKTLRLAHESSWRVWVFARGSCGLHCRFVPIWFLVKLCGLSTNVHYTMEATSPQNMYMYSTYSTYVRTSTCTWHSVTRFSKMVHESVNEDLDILVVKELRSHESSLCDGLWALCEGSWTLRNHSLYKIIHKGFAMSS